MRGREETNKQTMQGSKGGREVDDERIAKVMCRYRGGVFVVSFH